MVWPHICVFLSPFNELTFCFIFNDDLHMGLHGTKPVFGVSNKTRLKQVSDLTYPFISIVSRSRSCSNSRPNQLAHGVGFDL